MSKTKTKRMVASFLLLCAMSGTGVLADERLIMTQDETLSGLSGITTSNNGSGGAIVNNGFDVTLNGTYSGNKLENDKGAAFGGALFQSGGSITSKDAKFLENIVTAADQTYPGWDGVDSSSGGAMYINNGATGIFSNVYFKDNKALTITREGQSNGGAIFAQGAGKLEFTGGKFETNAAISRGGAFYNGDSTVSFNGTSFVGNEVSNGSGGAVYSLYGAESLHTINNFTSATFDKNKAAKSGGAIANYSGIVNITGGSFTDNTATNLNGGAIFNDTYWAGHTAELDIKGVSGQQTFFTGNKAGGFGGAIYNSGITSIDSTDGSILFSGNFDSTGANDIYLKNSIDENVVSTLKLTGSQNITFASGISGEDETKIESTASDLTLKGVNKNFKGEFTQTGGKITVSNNTDTQTTINGLNVLRDNSGQASFFGGTNKLTNTEVVFDSGTLVAGQNTWTGTNITIHDGVGFDNGTTVGLLSNSVLSFGDSTDLNNELITALSVEITGDKSSQIKKDGAGVLNITASQKGFDGTFTQSKGTVNLENVFFKDAVISSGVLNLKDGSDISLSSIQLDGEMNVNTNTTINGNVSGGGTINHAVDETTLTILGSNDAFTGTLNQQSGTLDIGDGTTVTTSFGKNDISGGTVNVKENATLTGINTISGGEVTLKDGSTLAGTNTISNGKVNINTSNNSTATNTITGGDVIVGSGVLFSGANTTLSGTGSLTVNSGATLSGLSSMSGNDSELNLVGAVVDNTVNIAGGQTTISDGTTIASTGSLNITGGTVTINQDITLGGTKGSITGAGNGGSLVMSGTNMTINGDMSDYQGSYTQNGGTIKIESGSLFGGEKGCLFGGENNISNAQITMGNASSTENSNLNLTNTDITISNDGLKTETGADGTINVSANGNQAIIGAITGDETSSITINDADSYLQIAGDASGYVGSFSQQQGTTEILNGGIFFGGGAKKNQISGGNFIFRDGAQLSSDVTIANKEVNLVIGDAGSSFQIVEGNKVNAGNHQFILKEVTLKDNLIDGGTEGAEAGVNFNAWIGENGGFEENGHYVIGSDGGAHNVTMETGSVAQKGSVITINDNSTMNINADSMNDRDSSGSPITGGSFNADLKSDGVEGGVNGTVNVRNENTDRTDALNFTSDNTEFNGQFNHLGGAIKFEGVDADNAAKFFNGTNLIGDGDSANGTSSVIFAANSVVQGQNIIKEDGSFVLDDGSSIDATAGINLTTGGTLNIINDDTAADKNVNLTVGVKGSGDATINKTDESEGKLLISASQNEYTGIYNHRAGTTVLGAGINFFGGTNNITGGTVDAATNAGAIINGINTITGTGNMIIGDTTVVNSDTITVGDTQGSDAGKLTLQTDPNNKVDLNVDFNIVSGAQGSGTVEMKGEGALNLDNPNQNLSGFTGVFSQSVAGVTNVFGKFFGGTNNITAGTLNMKNGSELVAGSTTDVSNGATLNIGAEIQNDPTKETGDKFKFDENSKVTIAGNITGNNTGNVNIGNGQVTIASTSDNSGFGGNYTQTGGVVTAQGGSTFFGAVQNLINKGKLIFANGQSDEEKANLASGINVELKGSTNLDDSTVTDKQAVLDLQGRTDAVFNGAMLYIDGKKTEGFKFTDGILENATLTGTQTIGDNAIVTLRGNNSGFVDGADVTINDGANVILGTGAQAANGSSIAVDSTLTLVSSNLTLDSEITGSGTINVEKDYREQYAPSIVVNGNKSTFTGTYNQDAGSVTVTTGSTFFGGTNTVTGDATKGTGGDLHLAKGSFLGSGITVTNSDPDNGGAFDPHGRVFIEDKIYDKNGVELTDINELMKGNLYYNTKLDADGNLLTGELKHITIQNGGLILSNGTVFDGSQGTTVFEKNQDGGVVDIGFSNGSGVDGDIELREDTMLSYGDGAYIKGDSILTMDGTSVLNFINDSETINYNPTIVGGGSIWKEGLGTTNISSAIDMTGQVKVTEGTLNFTNKDKVVFNGGGSDPKQDGSLTVGSDNTNAVINISANNTTFGGNVSANAQDGSQTVLNLKGANTTIGGTLTANNTASAITGNTTIGGNWTTSGDSTLSLLGGSANQIVVNGDFIVENVKDGQLPISFDYDPRGNRLDEIVVNGNYDSDSPLLITGINFITSPQDYTFDLSADRLFNISGTGDPEYAETSFYANTAMGRYFITGGGAAGSDLFGNLVYLNPQQYRGQVATIAAWQNQLLVNNLLFDHMNLVTRKLMDDEKTANKYAAAVPQIDPYQYSIKDGSLWYKAYGAFETLSMTKGLNVGNNAYGSLIGADFPLINLKHGWKLVPTAYIGYNGAHQHYNGVSMYQNGAQLGLMGTAYKGDFMTSLLAYGGGYGNDMTIRGGFGNASDNTGNWFAGVASKSAYNIRLPHDFIIQPTIMAAYNAFGQQNWGSDFGVMSMSSGMLNGLNVAPGVNFILQKKTFSLYAMAQLVYNVMGGVDGTAGNIDLGYVRMRHCYFEYGLGAMKQFKDRFTGYLQFTIRNGGRTGIGFSGGLNWKVGK